jgi:hypothetical protein
MSLPNAARTLMDDCQGEHEITNGRAFHRMQRRHEQEFCDGFEMDSERIKALAAPWNNAMIALGAAMLARDPAALQLAFEEVADCAKAFVRVDEIASLAERRISLHRRREPRTR